MLGTPVAQYKTVRRQTIIRFIPLALPLLFVGHPIQAEFNETVSYPEKNARFTIEVPKGWEAKHEDGAIRIVATASALFLLQAVPNVKDDETAKQTILYLAELQGKNFELQNAQISTHVRYFEAGEFKGVMTDAQGTDKAGYETCWQVVLFAPKEGEYFLLTSMWTKRDGPVTESDRAALFRSVKSL